MSKVVAIKLELKCTIKCKLLIGQHYGRGEFGMTKKEGLIEAAAAIEDLFLVWSFARFYHSVIKYEN